MLITFIVLTSHEVVIIYEKKNYINLTKQEYEWVINYATSFHVTPYYDYLTSYTTEDFGNVKIGNQGVSNIVGIGEIWYKTNIGCKLNLKIIRHIFYI